LISKDYPVRASAQPSIDKDMPIDSSMRDPRRAGTAWQPFHAAYTPSFTRAVH